MFFKSYARLGWVIQKVSNRKSSFAITHDSCDPLRYTELSIELSENILLTLFFGTFSVETFSLVTRSLFSDIHCDEFPDLSFLY